MANAAGYGGATNANITFEVGAGDVVRGGGYGGSGGTYVAGTAGGSGSGRMGGASGYALRKNGAAVTVTNGGTITGPVG